MPDVLLLILLSLATYRITRLITADSFPPAYRLREQVVLRTVDTRWESVGDLWQCAWCMSVWVSAGLVVATDVASDVSVPVPLLAWPAVAAVAAWISHLETAVTRTEE